MIQNDDGQSLREENRLSAFPEFYPNGALRSSYSPLGEAIVSYKIKAVKALLEHPRIDTRKTMPGVVTDQPTALLLAMTISASEEDSTDKLKEIFKILVDSSKVDINNSTTLWGDSIFFIRAVIMTDLFYMKELLKAPTLEINKVTVNGASPLRWTLILNDIEKLRLILEHPNCMVNLKSNNAELASSLFYQLPLAVSVGYDNHACTALLLSAGANPNGVAEQVWYNQSFHAISIYELNYRMTCMTKDSASRIRRLQIANWLRGAGAAPNVSTDLLVNCRIDSTHNPKELAEILENISHRIKKTPMSLKEIARRRIFRHLQKISKPDTSVYCKLKLMLDSVCIPNILHKYMRYECIE